MHHCYVNDGYIKLIQLSIFFRSSDVECVGAKKDSGEITDESDYSPDQKKKKKRKHKHHKHKKDKLTDGKLDKHEK